MARRSSDAAIMLMGFNFCRSKTLLSAVELELFTLLGNRQMTGEEIRVALSLHPRGIWDFLDTLISMRFLLREGDGPDALYGNTPETAHYLVKSSPAYVGGILEMANSRLYALWDNLTEALRTGQSQWGPVDDDKSFFEQRYEDSDQLEEFMNGMVGISAHNFHTFVEKFDLSKYETLCDVGGATGQLAIMLAREHPHLTCTTFDLPAVQPVAERTIAAAGLADRITAVGGDFFKEPLPQADVITMGMVLHNWNLEKKMQLIQSAYDSLPAGGALVAIEHLIDDERRLNAYGLVMSLNMMLEYGDAFDFTGADFGGWCEQVGFRKTEVIFLDFPAAAAVAYK